MRARTVADHPLRCLLNNLLTLVLSDVCASKNLICTTTTLPATATESLWGVVCLV